MSNLLPENNKKKIKKEYFLRLFIVVMFFSAGTMVLSSVYTLPSYFLSNAKMDIAKERVNFLGGHVNKTDQVGVSAILSGTNEKLRALNSKESKDLSEIINTLVSKKNRNIKITGITIRSGENSEINLFVRGRATNRDGLISFSEKLKTIPGFVDMDFPISNLAKNENINFEIKVRIKNASISNSS